MESRIQGREVVGAPSPDSRAGTELPADRQGTQEALCSSAPTTILWSKRDRCKDPPFVKMWKWTLGGWRLLPEARLVSGRAGLHLQPSRGIFLGKVLISRGGCQLARMSHLVCSRIL